jgi:hypothetical protein
MGMRILSVRRAFLALALAGSVVGLSACDPATTGVNGSVGVGVYYDSMLWNDYYYGRPRPPHHRPVNPPVTRPPVGVTPPIGIVPPGGRPPTARPPIARPPIHRPAGGGGRFR